MTTRTADHTFTAPGKGSSAADDCSPGDSEFTWKR